MDKFTDIIQHYRYIDTASWDSANNIDLNAEEIISILSTEIRNKHAVLGITILAFHSVWNHKNIQLALQIINHLLELNEEILYPFFYFLISKAYYFNGEYHLSLTFLDKAEASLQTNINGNSDYRKLLTCIGSLNDADPKCIEHTVMKAIIFNEKGNNYYAMGIYDDAINAFTSALHLQTKSYSTIYHANIAYTHRNMGKSFLEKGMHREALEQNKQADSIARIIYKDKYHPEVIEINTALEHCLGTSTQF